MLLPLDVGLVSLEWVFMMSCLVLGVQGCDGRVCDGNVWNGLGEFMLA